MITKEFIVNCKEGFHLRPAQVLVETVTPLKSTITLKKLTGDEEADAKSILGLMSLGLENGEKVLVEIDGPDEEKAMQIVGDLFNSNFGE